MMTKRLQYAILLTALLLLAAEPAFAQAAGGGAGNLVTFIQNVVNLVTGALGQSIAVAAIAVSGIMMMFGVARFHTFVGVILGVAIIFSSAWIMQQITGGGAF